MAEWLGTGLQNLLQRFESASDLTKTALETLLTLFFFCLHGKILLYRAKSHKDIGSILPPILLLYN